MKKLYCLYLLSLCPLGIAAQSQSDIPDEKSLYETVTKIEKKTDKFNLYLNMHSSFNVGWADKSFDQSAFRMDQLRIEARGNINDWIYYRWRQRLNRGNNGSDAIDNLPASIDYAAVGFNVTPKFSIFGGKQCTVYGGFEFDLNPIEIYEYSDMIENMSNFMTGVTFTYDFPASQQLAFQVLDSRSSSFEDTYGYLPTNNDQTFTDQYGYTPEAITKSKASFVYTLNWNGSFADGLLKTRWSASILNEAKKKNMYYYALGTELNLDKVNTFFDFMYSREAIDRNGIMTSIINNSDYQRDELYTAMNAKYMSYVWKFNYRVAPKVNLFVKGMYETAGLYAGSNEGREEGRYRTAWGYLGGVEYYPMKTNLHFFLTFIGRTYLYTDRAKELGFHNYSTQRISTGFIYQLPLF